MTSFLIKDIEQEIFNYLAPQTLYKVMMISKNYQNIIEGKLKELAIQTKIYDDIIEGISEEQMEKLVKIPDDAVDIYNLTNCCLGIFFPHKISHLLLNNKYHHSTILVILANAIIMAHCYPMLFLNFKLNHLFHLIKILHRDYPNIKKYKIRYREYDSFSSIGFTMISVFIDQKIETLKCIYELYGLSEKDSECSKLFCLAARGGYYEKIQWLYSIKPGIDVNDSNNVYDNPMRLAILRGNIDIVKFLHSKGATFPHIGSLYSACGRGYYRIVEFLLNNYQIDIDDTAFMKACMSGNFNLVMLLHNRGAKLPNLTHYPCELVEIKIRSPKIFDWLNNTKR